MTPHPHLPRLQAQIAFLLVLFVAGLLLVSYRAEVVARDIKRVGYESCLARSAQAEDVNQTRANVGRLILALVPDANPAARDAMLEGMVSGELVATENCDLFRQ